MAVFVTIINRVDLDLVGIPPNLAFVKLTLFLAYWPVFVCVCGKRGISKEL